MIRCKLCFLEVEEFIWHESEDVVRKRYECIVHGPTDAKGKPLPQKEPLLKIR